MSKTKHEQEVAEKRHLVVVESVASTLGVALSRLNVLLPAGDLRVVAAEAIKATDNARVLAAECFR